MEGWKGRSGSCLARPNPLEMAPVAPFHNEGGREAKILMRGDMCRMKPVRRVNTYLWAARKGSTATPKHERLCEVCHRLVRIAV